MLTMKEIDIKVPTSWEAITLKTYLNMQKDLIDIEQDDIKYFKIILKHLCKINSFVLNQIPISVMNNIKEDLISFMNKKDFPLQRFVIVNDVEYGLEPDLSQMSYGAYIDITKFNSIAIDDNWSSILSILYRPIKSKRSIFYEIEPYNGNINKDLFLNTNMQFNFGVYFFFVNLSQNLVDYTQKYLIPKISDQISHNTK